MIFCSHRLTFDLCRFTYYAFYNWTARHAHSGSLQMWNVNSRMSSNGSLKLLPISDNVSVVDIQDVLVQHFRVLN